MDSGTAGGGTPGQSTTSLWFFGGKGGVGKTTLATAAACLAAEGGQRTLLVSTDPAHSTADLLGGVLGNTPVAVRDGLWAVEIDAAAEARAHVERVARDAETAVSPEVLPAVRRHLALAADSPGTVEAALFDRCADLIARCPGDWDRLVFDTAPTGHTLRLLALPHLLTGWVEGMVRQREKAASTERMLRNLAADDDQVDDPVMARLRERRDRFRLVGERLLDDALFWLVLVPERLAIEETARAAQTLATAGVRVGGLMVNRVWPGDGEGAFMRGRVAQQREYLAEIARRFSGLPRVEVAQAARDITGAGDVTDVARQLRVLLSQ